MGLVEVILGLKNVCFIKKKEMFFCVNGLFLFVFGRRGVFDLLGLETDLVAQSVEFSHLLFCFGIHQ